MADKTVGTVLEKLKGLDVKILSFIKIAIFSIVIVFLSGCGINDPIQRVWSQGSPKTDEMSVAYDSIKLKRSSTSEVLSNIKQYEKENLSQSDSVIAAWGEKNMTAQIWTTLVSFDDETFTASRKYFFTVNEKPWMWGLKDPKLWLQTNVVVDQGVLDEAYSSQSEKRIAIIEYILENIRDDYTDVKSDSRVVNACAMMNNQAVERLLYVLRESPGLAQKLTDESGLEFDHMTLGKSWAYMNFDADIVELLIRTGKKLKTE